MTDKPADRAPDTPSQDDSDYETEEECEVHVSVSGLGLQDDLATIPREQIAFLDVASARPLVTIGGQAFVGEYEDTVGTSLFFRRAAAAAARDPVFGRQLASEVSFLAHTRKKLKLKRVFLTKKPKATEEPISESSEPVTAGTGAS